MILDDRLEAVAGFVPAGCKVADIGTDHGYLAMELYKRDREELLLQQIKMLVLVRQPVIHWPRLS